MANRADDLFAADGRLDVAITRYSAEFAVDLASVLRSLQKRVNALVRQMERENGRVVSTQASLGIAQTSKQQLEQALVEAGYGELVNSAYSKLPSLVAISSVANAAAKFSAFDVQVLDAFRSLKARELVDLFGEATTKASGVLLRGVLGAQDESELVDELMDALNETSVHARTLYETGMSEFSQTHEALHTDGTPDEAFLYTGPIDARIRPFCLARVGRVFDRKAIDAMDNGQLDNTFVTRGGYRCRHMWRSLSQYSELQALVGTGAYATPRAEAQVAHVTQAMKDARLLRGTRAA